MPFQLLTTVTLEDVSGFTEQSVQNSFAFTGDVALSDAVILDIHNAVDQFYNGSSGQLHALGFYISGHIDRAAGAMRIRSYDISGNLDGSPHGSPVADDAVTLVAASAASPMPSQAAGVLTLRARNALEYAVEGAGGIRPRSRHTGRLYLGPLNRGAALDVAGSEARPHADFISDSLIAAENLQDALVDGDYAWGVWSRRNEQIVPITRIEMANSWGTIRSRKSAPTVRTARVLAPVPALILGA